ncbi:hypothetical protein [Helicobacter burdigaliensis]|uniref:hypothetical protein n=1 Tax=Helicobacter burdigaliensis TaxID=2315334 RepID=UPI000EF6DF9A|nr:hypothetical protein [Helicobacter burdigaliensis]
MEVGKLKLSTLSLNTIENINNKVSNISSIATSENLEEMIKKGELLSKVTSILGSGTFVGVGAYAYDKKHYFSSNAQEESIQRVTTLENSTIFTPKGKDKYLETSIGKVEVFLDLEDDNDKYGVGGLSYMGQLINLDINQDGFLDSSDKYFDKLKIKGVNKEGEEFIYKLSDVYSSLDLSEFVTTQKDIDKHDKGRLQSGTSLFRAEESYKKVKEEDIKKLFNTYGDENGYIDLTKSYKDKNGVTQYVNDVLMNNFNFAFMDKTLSGATRLERFSMVGTTTQEAKESLQGKYPAYATAGNIKDRFNLMYHNYYSKEGNSFGNKLAIEREFQVVSGMAFSESKFKEVYLGINNPKTMQQYADALDGGLDSVNGMQLNKDGSITLHFISGKTQRISELYSSKGEFNLTDNNQRASMMSEASTTSEEELNKLDFREIGIEQNGSIISLADLGVKFIQKEIFSNGKSAFILNKYDGSTITVNNLYKIINLDNLEKLQFKEEDKLRPKFEWEV